MASFTPVRLFHGGCAFAGGRNEYFLGPLAGAVLAALAEPAIKVAFSTAKSAVKEAGEDKTITISAHTSFSSSDYEQNNAGLPNCIQLVAGLHYNSANAFEANQPDYVSLLWEIFPEQRMYLRAEADGADFYADVASQLVENRIYMAAAPDLFIEIAIMPSPSKASVLFAPTAIAYGSSLNRGGINVFSALEAKDLAVTLQFSGPGQSASTASGEVGELYLSGSSPAPPSGSIRGWLLPAGSPSKGASRRTA